MLEYEFDHGADFEADHGIDLGNNIFPNQEHWKIFTNFDSAILEQA